MFNAIRAVNANIYGKDPGPQSMLASYDPNTHRNPKIDLKKGIRNSDYCSSVLSWYLVFDQSSALACIGRNLGQKCIGILSLVSAVWQICIFPR